MKRRRPLIVGNWKMNGLVETAIELAETVCRGLSERERRSGLPPCDVVVAPPFTAIHAINQHHGCALMKLCGQDMSANPPGPYTGEISGIMLRNVGCRYVILGHSERRERHHEDNALVGQKCKAAFRDGLLPIVCVGENLTHREQGQTLSVVAAQVDAVLDVVNGEDGGKLLPKLDQWVVAYEPIWAIGTGHNASTEQIQEVHGFMRERLAHRLDAATADKIRLLYGGSVKPANAREILALEDVDGALVGGASLNAQEFLAILDALPGEA